MKATVQSVIALHDSQTLRHVKATIEREQIAAIELQNGRMTQSNVGQLEILAAIGAELSSREDRLSRLPAWVEVRSENGFALSNAIRVF